MTVGNYINCALYSRHSEAYSLWKRATDRADLLFVSMLIVRYTLCNLGLTVRTTGQQVGKTDCGSL